MRRALAFWFVLTLIAGPCFAGQSVSSRAVRTIYGQGTNSCDSWFNDRRNTPTSDYLLALRVITREMWVLGFVEGAGARVSLRRSNPADMLTAVNRYCAAHSLKTIDEAARTLVEELMAGATTQQPSSAPDPYYSSSCGKWLADRKEGAELYALSGMSWLTGFVSAADNYGRPLKKTDSAGMEAWINRYCSNHLLDSLHEASEALARELAGS